jgi:hypothetical protein
MVTGNLVRIGLIAAMIRVYGLHTGYQLGHLVLGSLISIVCIASSMVILTVIITGHGRQRTIRSLSHGQRGVTA